VVPREVGGADHAGVVAEDGCDDARVRPVIAGDE
jgi:hypothetical protein